MDENSKMNNKVTRIPGIPEDLVLTAEHPVTGGLVKRFVNQIMHQTLNKRDSGILRCTPGLTPMPCQVSSYPFLFYSTSEIVFNSVMNATGKEVFLTLAVFLGTAWCTRSYQWQARLEKTFLASTSDPLAPVNPSPFPFLSWLRYSDPQHSRLLCTGSTCQCINWQQNVCNG